MDVTPLLYMSSMGSIPGRSDESCAVLWSVSTISLLVALSPDELMGHQSCSIELRGKYDPVFNRGRHHGRLANHPICWIAVILFLVFTISYTHIVMCVETSSVAENA